MQYTIELYTKKKNYKRDTYFVKSDITSSVVMPIIDVQRLDRALDTTSLILINKDHKTIKPFSKVIIRIDYGEGKKENIYRFVHDDSVELISYGTRQTYRHTLSLIEPTKWLERFIVDNTTITNLLGFLYSDTAGILPIETPVDIKVLFANRVAFKTSGYTNNNRYMDIYYVGAELNTDVGYQVIGTYSIFQISIGLAETSYKIIKPNGEVISSPSGIITLDQVGTYKVVRTFRYFDQQPPVGRELSVSANWTINVIEKTPIGKKRPERYTLKQVINRVLEKISDETTAPRQNLDNRLFFLDTSLDYLDKKLSPEFTFTQNTLFGVLEQIGNDIQAIPRLVPTINGDDDFTNWNTITFDFLGGDTRNDLEDYKVSSTDYEIDGDNFTSGFVSNVENSFQTNNVDYISLKEPFDYAKADFISTRTEDANFEISNDHAVIKTSRPIQRVISLIVGIKGEPTSSGETPVKEVDISRYVKESHDYSLLGDYAESINDIANKTTKSTAIYYTRGENIIRGLDYHAPNKWNIDVLLKKRAIENIINAELGTIKTGSWQLQDLMFNIEYVPFYSFKAKQYKPLIDENSGDNELFYNQQNAQSVDIESYGENMRGALMMTGNVEKTITGYITDKPSSPISAKSQIKAGDLLDGYYYAYQINREFVNNNTIKTTGIFSKNFNKWNAYLSIKKNYREYEISSRECVEMNPISNEFCIISDETDFGRLRKDPTISQEEKTRLHNEYKSYLTAARGFNIYNSLENIAIAFGEIGSASPVRWAYVKTKTEELNFTSAPSIITRTFLIPCACFSMGNAVVMNFTTQDNYSAGTTAEASALGSFMLENFIPYGNKYGNVDTMAIAFGAGMPYEPASYPFIEEYDVVKKRSKQLYKLEEKDFKSSSVIVDYYSNYPFIINKDNRQQINFTAQLNFVTDKSYIWISSNIPKYTGFVGNQEDSSLVVALFKKAPNKYLNEINVEDIIQEDSAFTTIDSDYGEYIIKPYQADVDCVGFGLIRKTSKGNNIDKTDKFLLYYNKEFKAGDELPNLYLQVRRKI